MTIVSFNDALARKLPIVEPAGAWPEKIKHLSATSMGMFTRCPEQYRRRYFLGEKGRPAAALVWGSADHKAVGWGLEQKILNGELPTSNDVMDRFAQAWTDSVEEQGGESEVSWDDDKPGDLKTKAAALVRTYHEQVSPLLAPVAVEHEFNHRIPGVPVPVNGWIDIVTTSFLVERKTSKRRESTPKNDWLVQGKLYSTVVKKPVEFHVSTKTTKPAVYTPASDAGLRIAPANELVVNARVQRIANSINHLFNTYGPDEPWPDALAHSWACGYCSYRPNCHWWQ